MPPLDSADIPIKLIRKNILRIYLRIQPDASVTVTAPLHTPPERIQEVINSHTSWIRRKVALVRARLLEHQNVDNASLSPSKDTLCTPQPDQTLTLWGEKIELAWQIPALRQGVTHTSGKLLIAARRPLTSAAFQALVQRFYKEELQTKTAELWAPCQQLIGVRAQEYHFRSMRTRWGSCNVRTGRICLNLELVHYPPICLRYILTHELVHLLEKYHNARFYGFMDQFMPEWPQAKRLLKSASR